MDRPVGSGAHGKQNSRAHALQGVGGAAAAVYFPIMTAPLCPLVLGIVAREPRDAGGVARELARHGLVRGLPAHQAATVTLRRLEQAGLVYARGALRSRRVFRTTRRGQRELAFQCGVAHALTRGP
jgi:hypothetical protein